MRLSNEAKVGLMVTLSFTVFIVMVGFLAKINVSKSGYQLRIYYSFLNDLGVGASVKIGGGIKIGEVIKIKQYGEKTEVVLWIKNEYKLTKSTSFAIFTTGIIGEKYINVIVPPVNINEGYLKDGDIKYGIDPASFDRMMQTFQQFLQDKNGGEILADIFKNSDQFVSNLNEIVSDNKTDVKSAVVMARSTIETLSLETRELMKNVNIMARNVAELSEANKQDVNTTLKNLAEATTSLNRVTYRIESGKGSLGKLIHDEEVYNNLRDASIYAKDLFYDLKQDPSKLFFKSNR